MKELINKLENIRLDFEEESGEEILLYRLLEVLDDKEKTEKLADILIDIIGA